MAKSGTAPSSPSEIQIICLSPVRSANANAVDCRQYGVVGPSCTYHRAARGGNGSYGRCRRYSFSSAIILVTVSGTAALAE